MAEPSPPHPLEATLAALLGWFRAENVRGMVIGGVAASLLGRPRTTRDVDALVLLLRHEPPDRCRRFARWAPFEDEALARVSAGTLGNLHVPLPTPEDLVLMKAIAHRPRGPGRLAPRPDGR